MARTKAAQSNAVKKATESSRLQSRLQRQKEDLQSAGKDALAETPTQPDAASDQQAQAAPVADPASVKERRRPGRPANKVKHASLTLVPEADTVRRLRVYAAEHGCNMSDVLDVLVDLYLDDRLLAVLTERGKIK